jgi:AraC family transcriptional regulator
MIALVRTTREKRLGIELLQVRPASAQTAAESFTVESGVKFARGWVEVRQYTWAKPTQDIWTPDAYFLDISLSPRTDARGSYLGLSRRNAPETIGRVMLVPPGHTLQTGCELGRQRSMHCVLEAGMIEDVLRRAPSWDEASLREALHINSPEIEWLLLKIYREMRQAGFASEMMVEAFANALAVELVRRFRLHREEPQIRIGGLAPWRMRRLRERVHADLPAPSLTELAELCGMTVRHLSRAFKAETGQTLGKYVEAAMVERARSLLSETDASVGEVASALGFASSTSFAFAFRRATGLRPSEVEGRRPRRAAGGR